jgi:two-component system, chemotaxis family, CheB/CheR fusion protein
MPRQKDKPPEGPEAVEKSAKISPEATPARPSKPKSTSKSRKQASRPPAPKPAYPPEPLVVGVGASAGGLEAFTEFLRHLPRDTGMAYVLLQHLPAKQHSLLAQILSKATVLPVAEVQAGVVPEADHVYILPPGEVMEIRQGALRLVRREISEGRYLPVDTFLNSLAEERGSQAIGVILSGTASDGVQGMKAIKEAGGITFAQDNQTAKYSGMPQSSVAAGCVDFVLTPENIARELARIARQPYVSPVLAEAMQPEEESVFGQILSLLQRATGVDFTFYKHSTIRRRTFRRMALQRLEFLNDYLAYLKDHPEEISALYADILINVTSFSRDEDVFGELRQKIYPALMQNRPSEAPIRVWVPGCSTGEEVYSLAISLLEYLIEIGAENPIQIFGTDIDGAAINVAHAGRYGERIAEQVSPQRLRRFFVKTDSGCQIHKSIRDRCAFALQNLIKDPPFSHLDLISCRNVLIYLGPVLQKKIIPIFHFALKPGGYLLLGKSEAISAFQELFSLMDKRHKIYLKKELPSRVPLQFSRPESLPGAEMPQPLEPEVVPMSGLDLMKEADRIVLVRFAPAGVVVGEDLKILQFRGHTGPFLEPMPGEASLNLLRMVREGLRTEVGAALHHAIKGGTPVRKEGLKLKHDSRRLEVTIEVFPISPVTFKERFYLVVFEDVTRSAVPELQKPAGKSVKGQATSRDERLQDLGQELAALKLKLGEIKSHLTGGQPGVNEALDQASQSIERLVNCARDLSGDLRPQVLELGLQPAIRNLVEQFSQYFKIDAALKVPDLDELFGPPTQVLIYRVLQEALLNVVKHAQATRVSLQVDSEAGRVKFQVADNDIGFQVGKSIGVEVGKTIKPSPDQAWLVGEVPFLVSEDGKDFKAVPQPLRSESGRRMGLALMGRTHPVFGGDADRHQ